MKIFFSKKQYAALIKLARLGGWLANSIRIDDEKDTEIDEIEQYVFSFAKDFGMEGLFDRSRSGHIYPADKFAEGLDGYIDDYNEENFWEDLIYRLALRDFIEHYGEERVSGMDWKERIEKEQPFLDKYADEFYERGIENLRLLKGSVS